MSMTIKSGLTQTPFIPLLLLALAFPACAASAKDLDLRTLEDKATQQHLNNLIQVLRKARNVSVRANGMMPSDHEEEQARYCNALLAAAKEIGAEKITVPMPSMSTARNGNQAILDYVKNLTASPTSCPDDLDYMLSLSESRRKSHAASNASRREIPSALLADHQYPRLYSVYDLKGANPAVVVLNRLFYDPGYEQVQRAQWIQIRQNGCYGLGGVTYYFSKPSPSGTRTDNRESGVLEFDNQIFFYNIENTGDMPDLPLYGGYDHSHKWSLRLHAPQKSMEEIFSKEADAMIKQGHAPPIIDWSFYCEISFD